MDRKYYPQYVDLVPATTMLISVDHHLVERLVGFNFHRGILACGRRPPRLTVSELSGPIQSSETWLGLVGVQDPENLGGMLRSAAGLGIDKVWIGPGSADPLSRRALRVSMGNALRLALYYCQDLKGDMERLKRLGLECIATSLGDDSLPLEQTRRQGAALLLMGNERHGLPAEVLALADRRVRIDMRSGTDSLNVAVAAASRRITLPRRAAGDPYRSVTPIIKGHQLTLAMYFADFPRAADRSRLPRTQVTGPTAA